MIKPCKALKVELSIRFYSFCRRPGPSFRRNSYNSSKTQSPPEEAYEKYSMNVSSTTPKYSSPNFQNESPPSTKTNSPSPSLANGVTRSILVHPKKRGRSSVNKITEEKASQNQGVSVLKYAPSNTNK